MNGRAIGIIVLLVVLALLAGVSGYILGQRNESKPTVTDFDSCLAAGYQVMETDPRQCRTPDGVLHVEDKRTNPDPDQDVSTEPETREFTSDKGVVIRLFEWEANPTLSSPTTIKGEVPGNWSFEASFPVVLVDWDGRIIAEEPAQLEGDWMTTDYVPFSVTLTFDTPEANKNGSLILRKDNPSGLPESDDAVEIPITYQ